MSIIERLRAVEAKLVWGMDDAPTSLARKQSMNDALELTRSILAESQAGEAVAIRDELEALAERWYATVQGKPGSRRIATIDESNPACAMRGEDDFDNEAFAYRRCAQEVEKIARRLTPTPTDPKAGAWADDAAVDRALATIVQAIGNRSVDEYIANGGRRFWSPGNWHDNARHVVRAALTAAAPQAPVGGEWVLVPREPTNNMLAAAAVREDDEPISDWGKIVPASHAEIYKAMLAAAPPALTQPVDGASKLEMFRAAMKRAYGYEPTIYSGVLANGRDSDRFEGYNLALTQPAPSSGEGAK